MALDILSGAAGLNITGLVVNLIISTIVGGIAFLIVAKLLGRPLNEDVGLTKPFIIIFIINIINMLGLMEFVYPVLSMIPFGGIVALLLPAIIWVALVKMFIPGTTILHALIIGVLGWVLSIFILPMLLGLVLGAILVAV